MRKAIGDFLHAAIIDPVQPIVAKAAAPCAHAGACIAAAWFIGLVYGFALLGWSTAVGTSSFWDWPRGLLGGSLDIRAALSGYAWFVQDAWRWPLLTISQANWPEGSNAGLMDIVPVVGLIGKGVYSLSGVFWNPYPYWLLGTFALNAAALAALVRSLGQRSFLAAVLAAGLGAMAPVIHHRFGHLGHMAHWLPVFCLAIYISSLHRGRMSPGHIGGLLGLAALAAAVNLYLYVMVAVICIAAMLHAAIGRRLSWRAAALSGALAVAAGVLPVWAIGLFSVSGIGAETVKFGFYSMNLMAPFWPQTSGLFGWTGIYWLTRGSIGATAGQYEGYSYLGLGSLMLVVLALLRSRQKFWPAVRAAWPLALALGILILWAVSNRIYFGPFLVAAFPVPEFLESTVLAWFRSSARFFWPVVWLITALGIVGTLGSLRPRSAFVAAALALSLQWMDLTSWRSRVASVVDGPHQSILGPDEKISELSRMIAGRGRVSVIPSMFSSSAGADYEAPQNVAAVDVQLIAARVNARMTTAFVARGRASPSREGTMSIAQLLDDGVLVIASDPQGSDRTSEGFAAGVCRPLDVGIWCVNK